MVYVTFHKSAYISEVYPKSWDNLLENLKSLSPQISKNNLPLQNGENVTETLDEEHEALVGEEQEALVGEEQEALVGELFTFTISKILDLAPSQSDSGLGDNSLISGSDVEIPVGNHDGQNKESDKSGSKDSLQETGYSHYLKRSLERVNYKDLEDNEFICKYTIRRAIHSFSQSRKCGHKLHKINATLSSWS